MTRLDELLQPGLDVLFDYNGEDIELLAGGSAGPVTVKAIVNRNPVDAIGQQLVNSVQLKVLRSSVPNLSLGNDHFRILADKQPFRPPPEYVVERILSQSGDHLDLLCVK